MDTSRNNPTTSYYQSIRRQNSKQFNDHLNASMNESTSSGIYYSAYYKSLHQKVAKSSSTTTTQSLSRNRSSNATTSSSNHLYKNSYYKSVNSLPKNRPSPPNPHDSSNLSSSITNTYYKSLQKKVSTMNIIGENSPTRYYSEHPRTPKTKNHQHQDFGSSRPTCTTTTTYSNSGKMANQIHQNRESFLNNNNTNEDDLRTCLTAAETATIVSGVDDFANASLCKTIGVYSHTEAHCYDYVEGCESSSSQHSHSDDMDEPFFSNLDNDLPSVISDTSSMMLCGIKGEKRQIKVPKNICFIRNEPTYTSLRDLIPKECTSSNEKECDQDNIIDLDSNKITNVDSNKDGNTKQNNIKSSEEEKIEDYDLCTTIRLKTFHESSDYEDNINHHVRTRTSSYDSSGTFFFGSKQRNKEQECNMCVIS